MKQNKKNTDTKYLNSSVDRLTEQTTYYLAPHLIIVKTKLFFSFNFIA